jgi:hypothetical protein
MAVLGKRLRILKKALDGKGAQKIERPGALV